MTKPQTVPTALTFMPQLDGLRAIAVGAVLIHHLGGDLMVGIFSVFPFGHAGVRLFFVLSGFLITGILLRARIEADRTGTNPLWIIRQFYARRFLRIFPLYYFVIFSGAAINLSPLRDEFWWLVSYLYNFRLASLGWFQENISHFWSLAVEEQFYLCWPWLVLCAPRRALLPLSLAMIAIGPVFRILTLGFGMYGPALSVLTPSCFDALGAGAALAIVSHGATVTPELLKRLSLFALPSSLISVISLDMFNHFVDWPYKGYVHVVFYDIGLALLFCWLVAAASRGFSGIPGRFLTLAPVAYCGRIAYGIYVYHLLLSHLIYEAGLKLGLGWKFGSFVYFVVASVISVATAAVSWHFMEKPLNNLKRHFPYRNPGLSI